MREQSSNLQGEDRKAYAEQVRFYSSEVFTLESYQPQVALAFYKAIGGGSDNEDEDPI